MLERKGLSAGLMREKEWRNLFIHPIPREAWLEDAANNPAAGVGAETSSPVTLA